MVDNGILFKGERPLIPQVLHQEYIQQLHLGHIGVEATKRRARDIVFWISMGKDIENQLSFCSVCNSTRNHQHKEPMQMYPVPDAPWSLVAADLFDWNGMQYLVLVDSYSGWFDMNYLSSTTSKAVITKLKSHFAREGSPDTLVTDGGPQFSSKDFREFAKTWDFKHVQSSPIYPQSNGLAERAVQSAKGILEKTKRDGSDPYLALLNLRNTPHDSELGSPAQRLKSRRLKCAVPTGKSLLNPHVKPPNIVKRALTCVRKKKKACYDKNARTKPLPVLEPNQVVRMQTPKGYDRLGQVVKIADSPRSYIVRSNGGEYRRNRKHLLSVPEEPPAVALPMPVYVPTDPLPTTENNKVPTCERQPISVSTRDQTPKTPKHRPSVLINTRSQQPQIRQTVPESPNVNKDTMASDGQYITRSGRIPSQTLSLHE